jgi:Bacterial mobilisation protein (MobC)
MARPRKTDDAKRSYRLIIRLNADERKTIEAAANTKGLKIYAYARLKLLDGRVQKTIVAQIDHLVYLELKKIGVNLNQLTRIANSGRLPAGIRDLLLKLSEQKQLIIKILLRDRDSEDR